MNEHLTVEDLLRFHDGESRPAEARAVGRHLAACGRCGALAAEMFRDEPLSLRSEPAAPVRWTRWLAIAAAVALVLVGAAVLFFLSNRKSAPPRPAEAYERPEWNALVAEARLHGVTIAAPLPGPDNGVLRGPDAGVEAQMSPSGTAVESDRPELTWSAVAGAKYAVSVVADDDVVARSGTLDRNRWTPERPLPRGGTYAWQVRVIRGSDVTTLPSPPRPNPRFRVLAEAEVQDLAEARRRHPQDHFLLGVLAAHYGLRDEARRELARPRTSTR